MARDESPPELPQTALARLEDLAPDAHQRILQELCRRPVDRDRLVSVTYDIILGHSDPHVRVLAIRLLFESELSLRTSQDDKLLRALDDSHDFVRMFLLDRVEGRLRLNDSRFVPVIKKAMFSDDATLHYKAVRMWWNLGKDVTSGALPELIRALGNPSDVRTQAVMVLAWLGQDAGEAAPALVPLLEEPDPYCRLQTVKALTCIGSRATCSVPDIARLAAESEDPDARRGAAKVLIAIDPDASLTAKALSESGRRERWETLENVLRELGQEGRDFRRALHARRTAREPDTAATPSPPSPAMPEVPAPAADFIFRKKGDYWELGTASKTVPLKDSKGLRDIAYLLQRPGVEVSVQELVAAHADNRPPSLKLPLAMAEGLSSVGGEAGLEHLDAQAIREYSTRLQQLAEQRKQAEMKGDAELESQCQREYELIASQLGLDVTPWGHSRKTGGALEKARKAVCKRIKESLEKIEQVHPELGRHLLIAIRTGTTCAYAPAAEIVWDF